jgi:predicted HTH transcriptional regulator
MASDLVSLLLDGSEDLGVDYKAWMDLTPKQARAELAKDLAAIANHGGGFIIFGVDDKSRKPQGLSPYDLNNFGEDAIADIVKSYLDPLFHCRVQRVPLRAPNTLSSSPPLTAPAR